MRIQLREYQQQDVDFLARLPAAAIFNEQRTGKTPTALALIEKKNLTKVLIICPASAVYQWRDEYERWLDLPCDVCAGLPSKRQTAIDNWTNGLVISYDQLKIVERKGQVYGELANIIAAQPEAVILDEAHRIRNPKTAQAKAAFKLCSVPYRIALTGTPAPNNAYEIWSILHFLYPKTFTSYWKFVGEYFTVLRKPGAGGRSYMDIGAINELGKATIQSILKRIAVNRKRKEVMPWLPAKDYQKIRLPLTEQQSQYLHELQEYWETGDVVTQGVLDRLIRYRQICVDPGILGLNGISPKTEWLIQYLKDYPDRPTLVFSKFTSYLKRVAPLLGAGELIIGETPIEQRRQLCKLFQEGKLNLLLINIDAGKEALTLDRAEAAIFVDKYPPVGDISQAEDRFVATTEDKADKPHVIYDLIMRGSYETELHQMIAARYTETDVINNFKQHLERRNNHGNRTSISES